MSRKDSYIRTLQDAFTSAIEINREISFVDATTGRAGETRISQINEMDDSFPDYEINAMSTRSTDRSGNKSFDRSFDRSSSRSGSQNLSFNSRSGFRNNNNSFSSSNSSTQSRSSFGQKTYDQGNTFQPRNSSYQNKFDRHQGNGYNNNNSNKFETQRFPSKGRTEWSQNIPFRAGTVQYLKSVVRETPNSEHRLSGAARSCTSNL